MKYCVGVLISGRLCHISTVPLFRVWKDWSRRFTDSADRKLQPGYCVLFISTRCGIIARSKNKSPTFPLAHNLTLFKSLGNLQKKWRLWGSVWMVPGHLG